MTKRPPQFFAYLGREAHDTPQALLRAYREFLDELRDYVAKKGGKR